MSEDEIADMVMKLLKLPNDVRERVLRIVREHHPAKISKALKNTYVYTKHGKEKTTMTLEEFEKMLKRFRF